jgi:hypothetical protein
MLRFGILAFAATAAATTTTPTAAYDRRVLTTLTIDVVDDTTGETDTSILHLRDGDIPSEAAVSFCADAVKEPTPDCADIIHQALEAQLQKRIDDELAFYLEVQFDDYPTLTTAPFLFFQGEDVQDAVLSYLSGHPSVATQENYDMLVQACWSRLTPMEEIVEQTVAAQPAVVIVDDDDDDVEEVVAAPEDTFSSNEDSAFYHCSDHFGSPHDPLFMECVQELWHGWGAMTVYQPPADDASLASLASLASFEFGNKCYDEHSSVDNEMCDTHTADMNFGSSAATKEESTPILNGFFTWSMFAMLCSVTFMSALFVIMKMQDDQAEEQIVAEMYSLESTVSNAVYDEVEVEKENTPLVKSKTRKSSRIRTSQRSFGNSLNNY